MTWQTVSKCEEMASASRRIRDYTPRIELCLWTFAGLFSPLGLCSVRRGSFRNHAKAGQLIVDEGVLEFLVFLAR